MTDANHFLAAIIAEPEDDLPRLVFADWLEEIGDDTRAEFIRLQCLSVRAPLTPGERVTVEARIRELLALHRDRWAIPGITGVQKFRRGFVEYLYIKAVDFLRFERHIAKNAPVVRLRLSTAATHLAALANVPLFSRLRALEFVNDELAGRLRIIFRPDLFPELRSLTLQNNRLWAEDLATLTQLADSWPKLNRLNLSGNPYSDDGLATLSAAAGLRSLRDLVLRSDGLPFVDCIHATGVAAFTQSTALHQLRLLNLAGHHIGDAGFRTLVESRNAQHLEVLDVSQNDIGQIGPEWAGALAASPYLRRLRELNLSRNTIDPLAAEVLVKWPQLKSGCTVDLRGCTLSPESRQLLDESAYRQQFQLDEGEPA
ncbi:TIGR02996 domain-containing protein [Limnoglobus roseus]|uniref:TIGR02996 domain-containing protein n=1 Tax=Limnoglobus roseus TaxID=2598579 RepID=A0A5C1ALS8_9BACT|nr:TIGR02996 domain-containing protein [Limnoglobus roseus]QEL19525.1 TIGR02996 domain-containing protein [Limnoglobus roseus]